MRTTVIVPIEVIGFHRYPKAPQKVSFLKNRHRHIFHIKIHYSVSHANREKEIFMMADQVIDYLYEAYGNPCEFGNMSCEHIAKEVLEFSKDDGAYKVEVLEDGQGGASVELFDTMEGVILPKKKKMPMSIQRLRKRK